MEASSAEERGGYLDLSRLSPGEFMGMAAAVLLFLSLWMPWFTTSETDQCGEPVARVLARLLHELQAQASALAGAGVALILTILFKDV